MLPVLFHNTAICKFRPKKNCISTLRETKAVLVDVYEVSVFKDYYGVLSRALIEFRSRTDQNYSFYNFSLYQSKVRNEKMPQSTL